MTSTVCSNRTRHCLFAFMVTAAQVESDSVINYQTGGAGWGVPGKPDYVTGAELCASGSRQSPIDIPVSLASRVSMSPLNVAYEDSKEWTMASTFNYMEVEDILTISTDGTATSTKGNGITMDSTGYTMAGQSAAGLYVPLNQFHFHTPSENTLDGVLYPIEMHMVHKRFSNPQWANGTLIVATVVSVMFKFDPTDAANPFVDQLLHGPLRTPQVSGFLNASGSQTFTETEAADQFSLTNEVFKFTGVSKYYAFNGSLTTPPCSEGINWRVLATPLTIARSQVKAFKDALAVRQGGASRGGDNRDVQPLNGRAVMASFSKDSSGESVVSKTYSAGPAGLLHVAAATLLFMVLA